MANYRLREYTSQRTRSSRKYGRIISIANKCVKAVNESSSALKGVTAASKVYTLSVHMCGHNLI